jgi:hypothetical protein
MRYRRRITPEQYRRAKTAELRERDRRIAQSCQQYEEEQRRIDEAFQQWVREQRANYTPKQLAAIDAAADRRAAEKRAAAIRREEDRRARLYSDSHGS